MRWKYKPSFDDIAGTVANVTDPSTNAINIENVWWMVCLNTRCKNNECIDVYAMYKADS